MRATALGALERLGYLDADTLAAALADQSPVVRRRAAALSAHHPEVLAPRVAVRSRRLGRRDGRLRLRRARAPTLPSSSGSVSWPQTMPTLWCARRPSPPSAPLVRCRRLAAILHAAARDKPAVRRRAVIALAPFEGPEVDAAIAAALQDRDWQVRQAAEDLLAP